MPNSTDLSSCTVQRPDASFCDAPTLPDAPFPICVKHASEVYGFLCDKVADFDGLGRAEQVTRLAAASYSPRIVEAARPETESDRAVVYYLAVGGLIKIGMTKNLVRRLREYPPNSELLAVEPGGFATETGRHRQFAHLQAFPRASRSRRCEWYEDVDELRAHTAAIERGEVPVLPVKTPHARRPDYGWYELNRHRGLNGGDEGRSLVWNTFQMRSHRSRKRGRR